MIKVNKKAAARFKAYNEFKNIKNPSIADEIKVINMLNITTLSGKLTGFFSVNSSPACNERCKARAKNPKLVCNKCYAFSTINRYKGTYLALEYNTLILSNHLFSVDTLRILALPTTNGFFRLESHGDVVNVTHARNYIRLVKTHNYLKFTVWSKNLDLWRDAFILEGKPDNLKFIASSPEVNKIMIVPNDCKWFVNKVFTVFTKKFARENNIDINCGSRCCATCLLCYSDNNVFYINELLKGVKQNN